VVFDGGFGEGSVQSVPARVRQVDSCDERVDLVGIRLDPGFVIPHEQFQAILQQRQSEIFHFMKAARGW
jgi:hypothetical protein